MIFEKFRWPFFSVKSFAGVPRPPNLVFRAPRGLRAPGIHLRPQKHLARPFGTTSRRTTAFLCENHSHFWKQPPNPPSNTSSMSHHAKSMILIQNRIRTESFAWTQYLVSDMFLDSLRHVGVRKRCILSRRRIFRGKMRHQNSEIPMINSAYKGCQHNGTCENHQNPGF